METGWVSYFKLEISDLAVGCLRDVTRPSACVLGRVHVSLKHAHDLILYLEHVFHAEPLHTSAKHALVANASTCSHYLFECLVHAFDRSSGASIPTDQALVKFIEAARIRFAARHALKCDRRKDFSTEGLLHMCGLR